jgi:hypothetical protein
VRRLCNLDDKHGTTQRPFYRSEDPVDVWINDDRSVGAGATVKGVTGEFRARPRRLTLQPKPIAHA